MINMIMNIIDDHDENHVTVATQTLLLLQLAALATFSQPVNAHQSS
jgi:hypothetical protein